MGALQKKFEPKTNDLKAKNDEIEALKKQMAATSVTETRKGELSRDIELKQKAFDRARQDAQEDFQSQQSEIGQRIFQKMGPVIMKYAQENGLGLILDTSTPWPNGPVLWANPASIDITKNIVDAYNAQSGVPAPAAGTTTRPAPTTRSTTPATKPPATTAPPKLSDTAPMILFLRPRAIAVFLFFVSHSPPAMLTVSLSAANLPRRRHPCSQDWMQSR